MKYYVDFGTGAGNEWVEGMLEDAKRVAEKGTAYTQMDVKIEDENGAEVARLPWWGVSAGEDDIVVVDYGAFGFYGEWCEY